MTLELKQTQSGLLIPSYIKLPRKYPTVFSLFAGCGGFDLGFIQAGFEVIGANDNDAISALAYMVNLCSYPVKIHYIDGETDKSRLNKACEKTINIEKIQNKGIQKLTLAGSGWISKNSQYPQVRNFWFGDVRNLRGQDILSVLGMKAGDIDCVVGGPPCQGFSVAGKRNIADPRNNLVYEFGRLIVELAPKTFVMEEVPAILKFIDPDGVPVLDKLALMLAEGGYGRWDMIKKAMLMQVGSVGVVKTMADINKKTKKKSGIKNKKKDKGEQIQWD